MRIMVVDDEAFALKLIARQIVNFDVTELALHDDALAALAEVERDPNIADVILCDLQMPRMDGVEFVRNLARIGYRGGVVLVSGEDARIQQTVEKLARAHRLNVLGSVRKPVAPEELRKVLYGPPSTVAAPQAAISAYGPDDLRRAIANQELVNHYQPKVAVADGAVTGVETLVRWRHPTRGIVFPHEFIPLAEEHGFIDELAFEVLRSALRQSRRWRDAGLRLQVAVNVSMINLTALDFPDFVLRAVRESRVPASSLLLEVTETRLMKDSLASLDILARLRLKHIGLSIDDFGTGHSSLAQLRDIPFDELKIDRSFVHGASRDTLLRAIVEASIAMARQVGMKTVAEGVEDREDWDFLRTVGSDYAQGYFIAKPMPASEIIGWSDTWETRRAEITRCAA